MGSILADLPMKLVMPSSFDNIKEIAFKTVPSASKIEIKGFLESFYGLEVEKVRTLNMQGKKKRRGARLIAGPSYKKVYVTLKNPVSIASDIVSLSSVEQPRSTNKQSSINKDSEVKPLIQLRNQKNLQLKAERKPYQRDKNAILTIGTLGRLISEVEECVH